MYSNIFEFIDDLENLVLTVGLSREQVLTKVVSNASSGDSVFVNDCRALAGLLACGLGTLLRDLSHAKVHFDPNKTTRFKKVGVFEKVSKDIFVESIIKEGVGSEKDYDSLKLPVELPERKTGGSAGHDFFSPFGFTLKPGESITVPTGIRCLMKQEWVLLCFPRSSLGCKFRCQLDNTVGIIDSDYYFSENEGHIVFHITHDKEDSEDMVIKAGEAFIQGLFFEYGVADTALVTGVRNGGHGSTN